MLCGSKTKKRNTSRVPTTARAHTHRAVPRAWGVRPPISTWTPPRLTSPSHLCPPNPGGCLLRLHYCADSRRHGLQWQACRRHRNRKESRIKEGLAERGRIYRRTSAPPRLHRQGDTTITNQRQPEGREATRIRLPATYYALAFPVRVWAQLSCRYYRENVSTPLLRCNPGSWVVFRTDRCFCRRVSRLFRQR